MSQIAHPELEGIGNYEFGWSDKNDAGANSKRGLNEEVVRDISAKKNEPAWMLELRLKGLALFDKKPMPNWGSDLSGIKFDTIKYFERFGGIREYLKTVVVKARENGYTQTIMGRRRYLPDLNHENRQRREIAERAALNAPIQGSAADIIKIAMLKVDEQMKLAKLKSRLLLQVHDELILEVAPGEQERLTELVKKQMSGAYKLNVPLDVNIGVGKSWDLAAH